jgi:hypothetical protein
VHDKAFAWRESERAGLVPTALSARVRVFDASELEDVDVFLRALARALSGWPAGQRFVLKPRLGTSGRGRVAGRAGSLDAAEVRGALGRLAARGGALLEPWLERSDDLSAQLFIAPDGDVQLLATLRPVMTRSGVCTGQRGVLDGSGAIISGSPHDEALRAAAQLVGRAAADAGYRGFCGLDALVFRDGDVEVLRPVVELNARFTLGTVAVGLVERARRAGLLDRVGAFELALGAPPEPGNAQHLDLGPGALRLAAHPAELDRVSD